MPTKLNLSFMFFPSYSESNKTNCAEIRDVNDSTGRIFKFKTSEGET